MVIDPHIINTRGHCLVREEPSSTVFRLTDHERLCGPKYKRLPKHYFPAGLLLLLSLSAVRLYCALLVVVLLRHALWKGKLMLRLPLLYSRYLRVVIPNQETRCLLRH